MKVVVIDYGLCNLLSVYNALKFLGIDAVVSCDPNQLIDADKVILPGVGAFEDGMNGLRQKGFIPFINDFVETGKLFLDICLGMELLMTKSYEFGEHHGLDLIEGEVVPFENKKEDGRHLFKVPHIGWNSLNRKDADWDGTILEKLRDKSEVYFVHSYYVRPENERNILSETFYGDKNFCSVVYKDNVYGCQFHPEKSSKTGLTILESFINI